MSFFQGLGGRGVTNQPAAMPPVDSRPAYINYQPDDITKAHGMSGTQGLGLNPNSGPVQDLVKQPYNGIQTMDDHIGSYADKRLRSTNFITVEKGQAGLRLLRTFVVIYSMFPGVDGARMIDEVAAPMVIDFDTIQMTVESYRLHTIQPTRVTEFGSGFGPSISQSRYAFAPYEISFATNFSETAMKQTTNAPVWNNLLLITISQSYRDFLIMYFLMVVAANFTSPRNRLEATYGSHNEQHTSAIAAQRQAVGCFDRTMNPMPEIMSLLNTNLTVNQMSAVDTMIGPAELKTFWLTKTMYDPYFLTGKPLDQSRAETFSRLNEEKAKLPKIYWVYSKLDPINADEPLMAQKFGMFFFVSERLNPCERLDHFTTLCVSDDILIDTTSHQIVDAAKVYFEEDVNNPGHSYLKQPDHANFPNLGFSAGNTMEPSPFWQGMRFTNRQKTSEHYDVVESIKLIGQIGEQFYQMKRLQMEIKHWITNTNNHRLPPAIKADALKAAADIENESNRGPHKATYGQLRQLFKYIQEGLGLGHLQSIYDVNDLFFDFCLACDKVPADPAQGNAAVGGNPVPQAAPVRQPGQAGNNLGGDFGILDDQGNEFTQARFTSTGQGATLTDAELAVQLGLIANVNAFAGAHGDIRNAMTIIFKRIQKWEKEGFQEAGFDELITVMRFALKAPPAGVNLTVDQINQRFRNLLVAMRSRLDANGAAPNLVPGAAALAAFTHCISSNVFQRAQPSTALNAPNLTQFASFYDFSFLGQDLTNQLGQAAAGQTRFVPGNYVFTALFNRIVHDVRERANPNAAAAGYTNHGIFDNLPLGTMMERLAILDRSKEHPVVAGFTFLYLLAEFTHENLLFLVDQKMPLPMSLGKITHVEVTGLSLFFLASGGQSVQLAFSLPESRFVNMRAIFQAKYITRARVMAVRMPDGPIFGFPAAKIWKVRSTDGPRGIKDLNLEFGKSYGDLKKHQQGFIPWFGPKNSTEDSTGLCFNLFNLHYSPNKSGSRVIGRMRNYMAPFIYEHLNGKTGSENFGANNHLYEVWPHTLDPEDYRHPTTYSDLVQHDSHITHYYDANGNIQKHEEPNMNPHWPGYFRSGAMQELTGVNIGTSIGGLSWLKK